MGGGVAGHALQTHGGVDELLHPLVAVVHFLQLGADLQCILQGDVEGGGHQLGDHVGLGVSKVQRAADVTDRATGRHGTEGGDLCHMVGTILTHDVLDDLAAAFLTEVRIEIGHGHALRVQESLENEGILHGIDFRDVHAVCHDGSRAGTTAGAHGDARLLGVADEVPDDQVIVDVSHAGNDANFIFQSLQIAFRGIFIPLLKAVHAELAEIFFVGITLRHGEGGQMILVKDELHIAHLGDLHRVGKGFVTVGEEASQFFLALEVELLFGKAHAVGVVHGLAGLDAQQDVLHFGVLFAQIVAVVGDHHGQARFSCQAHDALIHGPLFVDAVVLQFQIEMVRSENLGHPQGIFLCALIVLVHQVLGNTAGKTGGGGDQTLMVLFEELQIHTGLAVETVDKGLGHHQAEVLVALAVLAQQHQMVGVVVDAVDTVCHGTAGHIDLTADDGLDSCGLGGLVEIDAAVHNAVVGDGHGGLTQLLDPVHQPVDAAGTVQKAEFRMDMQMHKAHLDASLAYSTSRFSRWFMAGLVMGGSIISASSDREE